LDIHTIVLQLTRWIHFLAGITWIGHLYFFNLVNVPFQGTIDAETKKKVNPQLMLRALFWFRWGAMITVITGLLYVIWKQWIASDAGLFGVGGLWNDSSYGAWITLGGLLGIIMWFNVWFIIWPAQQKLIGWVMHGGAPPEQPQIAKRALLASRTNTYLSVPMLFAMGAAGHFPNASLLWMLGVIAVGAGIANVAINVSGQVGKPS
jgi:uncharacterized membrane protein